MPAALVTGSAKGIGRAFVLALAKEGYDVAVHYRSSHPEAEAVAADAASYGVKSVVLQADVTKPDEAQTLVREAHEKLSGLDVLINNVGNYHRVTLEEHRVEDWLEMFASNLHSTFYTESGGGAFHASGGAAGVSSILGTRARNSSKRRPSIVAYSAAKTGVVLYSKALAKTEAAHGITVNVLAPGIVENSVDVPDELPMGRTGRFEDLVAAALYLLSPEATYVTGAVLEVAGGWNL